MKIQNDKFLKMYLFITRSEIVPHKTGISIIIIAILNWTAPDCIILY